MAEQLFQVGVKALVRDETGRILLVRETAYEQSYWDIPGGRMEPGEDLLQTLVRELSEEIQVSGLASARQLLTVRSNKQIVTEQGTISLLLVVYEVKHNSGQKPIPGEDGLLLEWKNTAEAALLLADKYPMEFCEMIGGLE